jgi:two-component system response regulator AlgR
MKILIVDDEPLARSRLQDLLEDIGGHEVVGEAGTGREAIELTQRLHPDVLLLDIHMPEMNGMEVAQHLCGLEQAPAVIFTTAYSEHALEAFDANALDYLLKPIRRARLEQALDKAQPLQRGQIDAAAAGSSQQRRHISAHHRGGIKLVPVEEILYFQSDSKYVAVHSEDGEVLIDEPLKHLEQEFADRFTRIHRNCLVANACVEALEKTGDNQYQLRLRGCDTPLEVSRRQLPAVRQLISDLAD